MMKFTTVLLLLLLTSNVASFMILTNNNINGRTDVMVHLADIKSIQEEWKEQGIRGHAVEESLDTDPDLDGLVEHAKHENKLYIEKEAHKHDSLLSEIEHSLENDPDLTNIVSHAIKHDNMEQKKETGVNMAFVNKEQHVHDSFLNEVQHSIEMDPDLSAQKDFYDSYQGELSSTEKNPDLSKI